MTTLPNKEEPKFFSLPVNLGISGTSILCPKNPILPNGTVNFVFQIRGIAAGDVKTVGQTGLNAVVITAEAGGMGSEENLRTFGNTQWVNSSITKILQALSKINNGVVPKVGNIAMSSWSGGYSAVKNIVEQRKNLIGPLSAITIFDGIHEKDPNQIKPWVDYAKEAQKDPSKKFVIVHTDIKPPYTSSTESADAITNQLGLKKDPNGKVNSGGFFVYRIPGDDAKAHIAAKDALKDIWSKHLAPDWNQGTTPTPEVKKEIATNPSELVAKSPLPPRSQSTDAKKIYDYLNHALQDLEDI